MVSVPMAQVSTAEASVVNILIFVTVWAFGFWMGVRLERQMLKKTIEPLGRKLFDDIRRNYILIPRHQDITVQTVDEETGETRKGRAKVSEIEPVDKGNGYG